MATLKEAIEYAKNNPETSFATALRAKIESGEADDRIKEEGLQDLLPGYKPKTSTLENLQTRLSERGSNMLEIAKNTEINPLSRGLQGTGQIAGAVGDVIGAGIGAVAKGVDTLTGGNISEAGKQLLNTDLGKQALQSLQSGTEEYASFKEANPEFAGNLEAIVNIGTLVPIGGGASLAGKAVTETGETAFKGVKSLAAKAQELKINPEFAGQIAKSVVSQTSGISPEAITTIRNIAKKGEFDAKFSPDVLANPRNVEENVLKSVADDIEGVLTSKGEIGAMYKEVLEKAPTIKFSRQSLINDIVDTTGLQYSIKDGFKKTADTVRVTPTEISKLNDIIGAYKGINQLTPNQFIELRKAVGDLAYEGGIKTSTGKAIADKLYKSINEKYRKDIPGLADLDQAFSGAMDDIATLKEYFKKNPVTGELEISDLTNTKIANLLNRGKESKLASLEQYIPDLTDRIAYARTLRAIDQAQGNVVGTYGKTATQLGSAALGGSVAGVPGAIAAFIANAVLMNPTNVVKMIGKTTTQSPRAVKSLPNNISPTPKINNSNSIKTNIPQTKKGATGNVDMYDVGGAAMGGVQTDEEGNVTINPLGAILGTAGMQAGKSLSKFVSPNMAKNIAKKMDETDTDILNSFRDGYAARKLTDETEVATLSLLKDMGIDAYGLPTKQTKEVVDKILSEKSNLLVKTKNIPKELQPLAEEARKYKTTLNLQDKNDVAQLERIFSEDTVKDILAGKKTNWRGTSYEDLGKINIISETPKTVAQELQGKITPIKLKSDTFYHGTSAENAEGIMKSGFKVGSKLPKDSFRGGGYGNMQNSISFAESPKEASIFSTLTRNGQIVEAKLKPDAKVVSIKGVQDAIDLEDYIDYLKSQKIDAVYIGGGEKELVVINPKSIKANGKK